MRCIILLIFIVLYLLSSCRPSARFAVSDEKDYQTEGLAKDKSILINFVNQWLDTPYKYGGMSKSGVDCSGFSSIVMREVYDIILPRTAEEQYNSGEKIWDSWLSTGDLVFFKNFRGHGIDHVGIFLGNNQFAHATESNGVIVSDLNENYYRNQYVGACRYKK